MDFLILYEYYYNTYVIEENVEYKTLIQQTKQATTILTLDLVQVKDIEYIKDKLYCIGNFNIKGINSISKL